MIIGLSGYARSGKDTLGQILVDNYGYERRALADKMREALLRINPITMGDGSWAPPIQEVEWADINRGERLAPIVERFGWEGAKKIPEVRRLLQVLGTEVGRQLLGEDIWVNAMFADVNQRDRIAVTDVRFPNEAAKIKTLDGIVVRIERPSVEAVNRHVSETALDDWVFDYRLTNDGTIEELHGKMGVVLESKGLHLPY